MEMTMRWYGPGHDTVTLKQIRQIRYVTPCMTNSPVTYGQGRRSMPLKRKWKMPDFILPA
jgi:D-mannonate dehydratase